MAEAGADLTPSPPAPYEVAVRLAIRGAAPAYAAQSAALFHHQRAVDLGHAGGPGLCIAHGARRHPRGGPIDRILRAPSELRAGELSIRLPNFGLPELSRSAWASITMAATLESSASENQRLTRQELSTQEHERMHLAHELHDESRNA